MRVDCSSLNMEGEKKCFVDRKWDFTISGTEITLARALLGEMQHLLMDLDSQEARQHQV